MTERNDPRREGGGGDWGGGGLSAARATTTASRASTPPPTPTPPHPATAREKEKRKRERKKERKKERKERKERKKKERENPEKTKDDNRKARKNGNYRCMQKYRDSNLLCLQTTGNRASLSMQSPPKLEIPAFLNLQRHRVEPKPRQNSTRKHRQSTYAKYQKFAPENVLRNADLRTREFFQTAFGRTKAQYRAKT